MKAKLTRPYDIGQGITLMSGTEVEIISVMPIPSGTACTVAIEGYGKRIIDTGYLNVDESCLAPNWQQVRIQAAIAMMQTIFADVRRGGGTVEDATEVATRYADALVEELQKKQP